MDNYTYSLYMRKIMFKEENVHCDAVYLNYAYKYLHNNLTVIWS